MHRSRPQTSRAIHPRGASPLAPRARPAPRLRAQLAAVLALALCASLAQAQSTPQQLAEANRTAMEAYNNLDVEQARTSLEKAAKTAEKAGIRGPALARTYANLAVVLIGGMGDQQGAVAAFVQALKEDPKVEPDPIVATPEVMQAYGDAKGQALLEPSAEPAKPAKSKPAAPARPRNVPIEGNLEHAPVAEQLSQTAVPVFVKKSSDLAIASVKIAYRALGMKKPKTAEMQETDDGYTFLIPCTDVFEPVVEYFIIASDENGEQVGNSGTPQAPVAVPIVASRTQPAPSLPGQVPPAQCSADDECPPGMPGCSGNAGLGDTCGHDSDCQSGLICSDDFCSTGERTGKDEGASSSSSNVGKRFFLDLNFGVGSTYVGEGRGPDRNPSRSVLNDVLLVSRPNGMLSTEIADQELQALGWDCTPTPTENNQVRVNDCTVAVKKAGFVAVPLLNFAAGYHLSPRIAVALTGRIQLQRGEGTLAGVLLGARGEYAFTAPVERGLRVSGLVGFSVGQMQARPPPPESTKKEGPFATNGGVGGAGAVLQLGGRIGYRFIPNLGVNFTPALNFGFPSFLFALDLGAGVEVAF